MAVNTDRTSAYIRAEGFYDSAGVAYPVASTVAKLQYAATAHFVAYGSAVVTAGSSTINMSSADITTLAYFYATPRGSCDFFVTVTGSTGSNVTIEAVSGGAAVTAGIAVNWMAVNA